LKKSGDILIAAQELS